MIPLILLRLAPYAAVAAVAAVAVAGAHFAPVIGYGAQLHRAHAATDKAKADTVAWKANATAWQASYRQSESLRSTESKTAVEAVNAVQGQCSDRIAAARRSAVAIRKLVDAPVKVGADHCPVRETLDQGAVVAALVGR